MISKETTMCAALITYLSARASYAFDAIEAKNIYGIYSKDTANDNPADALERWYGRPVFELQHAFKTNSGSKEWNEFFESMVSVDFEDASEDDLDEFHEQVPEKTEFIRISTWGCVDSFLDLAPLNSVDETEYTEEYVENVPSGERHFAPKGLLVNQLTQVLDWDEMWKDEDFTTTSQAVYITDMNDLDRFSTEEHRVLDINAALAFHGLPSLDELAEQEDKEDEKDPDWVSPILSQFIEDYLELAVTDPRQMRAVGYFFAGC